MNRARIALLSLLLIAVQAQSVPGFDCACAAEASVTLSALSEHMSHHDSDKDTDPQSMHHAPPEHAGTHECGDSAFACECGACGQAVALLNIRSATPLFVVTLADPQPPGYADPAPTRALRPPISF